MSILQKEKLNLRCNVLNSGPPKRYVHVLISRTHEFYLIWKRFVCRCK